MVRSPPRYLWQQPSWPDLTFDPAAVAAALLDARRLQGEVEGKVQAIGLDRRDEVAREVFVDEVIATAAIEGEQFDPVAVRSSVMRKLGLVSADRVDRHVDGLVEVIDDATLHHDMPLTHDRLCRWQSALFPGGTSGLGRIAVGRYRDHSEPMQIVSAALGKPDVVYFEAPPSKQVPREMERFLAWFEATSSMNRATPIPTITRKKAVRPASPRPTAIDGLARAAIAHLWFETIHPFEDGNGRIGRAIVDMAIAQDHGSPPRLYSLSRELLESRRGYYDALAEASTGAGDVTRWVAFFAGQFAAACRRTGRIVDTALSKSRFWTVHSSVELNSRQRKVLQRLLDDGDGNFLGGLNAEKYMKMTQASKATATRDLAALVVAGLLWTNGQGKGVRYYVNVPGWSHGVALERLRGSVAPEGLRSKP